MDIAQVPQQYDIIGKDYIEGQSHFFTNREDWGRKKLREFCGNIHNRVILDAGCGSGIDTLTYLEGGASQILSFDPSEFMLTKARESIPSSQVIFRLGAYEHIPFEETCADILVG